MLVWFQSSFLFVLVSLLLLLTTTTTTILAAECNDIQNTHPLRVFILVGQSNMEGKGSTEHLKELLQDNLTRSIYEHYGTPPGHYVERDDVYLYFQDYQAWQSPLKVGYGVPHKTFFGPELEFGWVVGDDYRAVHHGDCTKTLLIKCAWGGKDLAVDFRSPSSGLGNYSKSCNEDTGTCIPYSPSEYGYYYRLMIQTVNNVLGNLTTSILPPSYTSYIHQYELSGFVWFQGWNDVIDQKKVKEYGSNLIHFMRDVRKDLNAPNLPMVVGEAGQAGPVPAGNKAYKHIGIRKQMRRATRAVKYATYVMTAPFVDKVGPSFNGNYHYYGRADTFFYIGRSFGLAMVELMQDFPESTVVRNITKQPSSIINNAVTSS